jgi:hypothetical protein
MMPTLPFVKFCAAAMVAALLAGCANGPPPWITAASANAVSLRWWSDEGSIAQAEQVADAHCALYGRSARLAQDQKSGSAEIADYDCR